MKKCQRLGVRLAGSGVCAAMIFGTFGAATRAASGEVEMSREPLQTITLGTDALPLVQKHFPKALTFPSFAGDRAVVQLPSAQLSELGSLLHAKLGRCGGFMLEESTDKALVDWLIAPEQKIKLPADLYTLDQGELVRSLLAEVKEEEIRARIQGLAAFHNRYYRSESGVASQKWVLGEWQKLASAQPAIQVRLITHAGYPQPSVELTWQGAGKADEVVVLGGHGDSIAGWYDPGAALAPGADDNASGIAVLTETLRILLAKGYQPQRTLKFYSYAAEEVGLRGSRDIAEQARAQAAKVVGVMQLDMTNFAGSPYDIVLISDHTNAGQNRFLGDLLKQYLPEVKWREDECGYACSDHASWTRAGYPASFPFESLMASHNSKIHTGGDTLANSQNQARHAVPFAQLALAFLVEMN